MLRTSKTLVLSLAALAVLGAVGVGQRLVLGERLGAFGSYVPWGLWVGLYIYLVGLSGGAFLVTVLHHVFGIAVLRRPARYAVPIALVTLGAGLALVFLDLGHPWRFWTLFVRSNSSSLLAWMVWVYTIYAFVLIAMLVATARGNRRALRWLSIAGFALVVTFGGGEGALFGVVGAKAFWNSGLTPIRFLFSAFLSGVALVAAGSVVFRRWAEDGEDREASRILRAALLALLAVNLVVEFAEISITLYAGLPSVADAYRLLMTGPHAWVFWGFQVAMGLVAPLVLMVPSAGTRPGRLALAGALVAIGCAGTKQNLVLAGLSVPEFRALPEAFVHPRLSTSYFPSPMEWLVAIGVLGAAALAFLLAVEFLPFLRSDESATGPQPTARGLTV